MKKLGYVLCFILGAVVAAGVFWAFSDTAKPIEKNAQPAHDIVYGRKSGMALTLDVLRPKNPRGIGVIFVISGGFHSDSRWVASGFIKPDYYTPILDRGQTVFLVSHSSNPKFPVSEIIKDVHRAIRYVRYNASTYDVDPRRLAIAGSSSGGYLSLLVATGIGGELDSISKSVPVEMRLPADPVDSVSSAVQAVGVFYAPSDLLNYAKDGQSYLERSPAFVKQAWGLDGKTKEEQVELIRRYSPYSYISAKTPPVMLVHGDRDPYVPIRQSERLLQKLNENHIPAELIVKTGGNHGWSDIGKEYEQVAAWFDQHLSPDTP